MYRKGTAKKKIVISALILSMLSTSLCGCGSSSPENQTEEETAVVPAVTETADEDDPSVWSGLPSEIVAGTEVKASPEMYSKTDLSTPYTVNMCLIGAPGNDWDDVLAAINEYLEAYNTTLEVTFIPWGDFQDDYQDMIEGDEKFDLVFTAPWCFMYSEAAKNIFYSLDSKFAGTYMPLTYKYQKGESWDETTLWGKTIAVPSNTMDTNGKMVAIRQDIADELGIGSLSSWDDYKNYLLAVAENITPETGIYGLAAAKENKELWDQYRQQYDTFYALESGYVSMIYQYDGEIPEYEDISFTYETDMFKDFCLDMKELADAGVWSADVLNEETTDDDAFANLEGASISWNKTVFQYVAQAEKNEGVECGVYFLTPGHLVASEAYSNNDVAILADSPNPERAAMVLDLLKFDTYLNHLVILGIEGVHYTIDSEGRYTELDKAADYGAGELSLAWAIKNGDVTEDGSDPRKDAILTEMEEYKVADPTITFVFDDSSVKEEMIAVDEILTETVPRLQLGLAGDVEASIDAMLKRCYRAGLQDIINEYKEQYIDWYATR